MNGDSMTQAYRMIYENETMLKEIVKHKLLEAYALLWRVKSRVDRTMIYYHDIVAYLRKCKPPIEMFIDDERQKLYELNNTRNKICHMKLIAQKEYKRLEICHLFVLSKTICCCQQEEDFA
ncbi:hypothetical protein P5616_010590 [Priestia aryabhattai]|uniref:hypothetical protein n=1 Tax=Priestia aryabhattai TaxID=412384 RepID=UPI0024532936|nr:hypothetical protein [Priestia aryabhattai]MDH3133598.1 hypothetical protein [Priestia aryabhattai]